MKQDMFIVMGMGTDRDGLALAVLQRIHPEGDGFSAGDQQLQLVPQGKPVPLGQYRVSVFVAADHIGRNLILPDIPGVFIELGRGRLAVEEAGAVGPVADLVDLVLPDLLQGQVLHRRVDAVAVGLGDHGGIVGGFHPALDLQAVDPSLQQFRYVVDHAQVLGV